SNPVNATIADGQGLGKILNDDVTIRISDVTVTEGNSGTKAFTFTVTLSAAAPFSISVNFATANGTATSASGDYQSKSGTLTFNPGVTTLTIPVLVNGDTLVEPDETFSIKLSNPTNATLADDLGLGTIINDDAL